MNKRASERASEQTIMTYFGQGVRDLAEHLSQTYNNRRCDQGQDRSVMEVKVIHPNPLEFPRHPLLHVRVLVSRGRRR